MFTLVLLVIHKFIDVRLILFTLCLFLDSGFILTNSFVNRQKVSNFVVGTVSAFHPKPEGRVSRLFFNFLVRELTFFGISLQGEGRKWEKETPCGKGLGSWDT